MGPCPAESVSSQVEGERARAHAEEEQPEDMVARALASRGEAGGGSQTADVLISHLQPPDCEETHFRRVAPTLQRFLTAG